MWPVGQAVKTPPFHGGYRGSNPLRVTIFNNPGRLAQLGERLPYKQDVGGSIPSSPTISKLGEQLKTTVLGCFFISFHICLYSTKVAITKVKKHNKNIKNIQKPGLNVLISVYFLY